MTLSLNYEAFHGYISIVQLMKHGKRIENSQTISVPPNVSKNKMHAIIVYFCRSLLFHTFKNAVLNVTKHLKCSETLQAGIFMSVQAFNLYVVICFTFFI